MDNLIQKFYGKGEEQKYTQFGAFTNSSLKNPSSNLNFTTLELGIPKITIGTINPSIHNIETKTQIPKTPNKTPLATQEAFLQPKKLIFKGINDLSNKTDINKTFANNKNSNINSINNIQNNIPSLNTIKQNMNLESKKNATKMQMMEEKMKNLELKSQRLEVINEFFFDMFENNLVKEELKRQNNIKEDKDKNEKKENNEENEEEYEKRKKKKKSKKNKIKNLKLNLDIQAKNQEEEELQAMEFKKKTKSFARNYLNTVKNDIGMSLVEEQLRKNEELHNMTEDIIELKGDLLNKLENMQMLQNLEMKKIAYCLQNSGDDNIENLANRLFGDNILKNKDVNNPNSFNNTNALDTGSVFNPRDSMFNTNFNNNIKSRRQSLTGFLEDKANMSRRQSINDGRRKSLFEKDKYNDDKVERQTEKEKTNKSKRQSIMPNEINVIPEEKNENEN